MVRALDLFENALGKVTAKLRTMDEDGGNVLESEPTATADTSGWTLTFPNRKPVPVRVVAVDGDSIVTEAGPYESPPPQGRSGQDARRQPDVAGGAAGIEPRSLSARQLVSAGLTVPPRLATVPACATGRTPSAGRDYPTWEHRRTTDITSLPAHRRRTPGYTKEA